MEINSFFVIIGLIDLEEVNMKITKYHQSCLLVESDGTRILIDPGTFGYTNEFENEWTDIDLILITHHHDDHCNDDIINKLIKRDKSLVLTTNEVIQKHHISDSIVIKEGQIIPIFGLYINIVKAVHGSFADKPPHCGVLENVGYIIDNCRTRLYVTSDTIDFDQEYECDVIAMPFNGHGLTLGIRDGIAFAKRARARMILPIHMEHPLEEMNPSIKKLEKELKGNECKYRILDIKEGIDC